MCITQAKEREREKKQNKTKTRHLIGFVLYTLFTREREREVVETCVAFLNHSFLACLLLGWIHHHLCVCVCQVVLRLLNTRAHKLCRSSAVYTSGNTLTIYTAIIDL